MPGTCVFCGSVGTMTGEHVLGDWLNRIGQDLEPVTHSAGWLNQIGRQMGPPQRPYQQKVRDVCGECNSGWMSSLERKAQRVLTPLILGEAGVISLQDQGAIAMWVQKTALTAMLLSSSKDRAEGYGLPAAEYHALYALREESLPMAPSQFWVGRYEGSRSPAVRVTPMTVRIDGVEELDQPQGYAIAVVIGGLALQGLRFTTPSLAVRANCRLPMQQFWPRPSSLTLSTGQPITDESFLRFVSARDLSSSEAGIALEPWGPAVDAPQSRLVAGVVELPAICGKHVLHYPASLVQEAGRGRFYVFGTSCECPMSYLIHTESNGAHCKAADSAEVISQLYESEPGGENLIEGIGGAFACKRLPT